jgi:hypothetical protein
MSFNLLKEIKKEYKKGATAGAKYFDSREERKEQRRQFKLQKYEGKLEKAKQSEELLQAKDKYYSQKEKNTALRKEAFKKQFAPLQRGVDNISRGIKSAGSEKKLLRRTTPENQRNNNVWGNSPMSQSAEFGRKDNNPWSSPFGARDKEQDRERKPKKERAKTIILKF